MVPEEGDRALIQQVRERLAADLALVPAYDDDLSLLRWLVGWERQVELLVPKLSQALRTIYALDLHNEDFSSIENINRFCGRVCKASGYIPGSLIGHDKQGNIISIQAMGRTDSSGLLRATMVSDMFLMRVGECAGLMQLLQKMERETGRSCGVTLILDLDGLSLDAFDWTAIKCLTTLSIKLQELFPDMLRYLLVIRAPAFMKLVWDALSSHLAKQTQQKIEFLGSDWKDRLKDLIDESVLFEAWGGSKPAANPFGDVRVGGKVPKELHYDTDLDPLANNKELRKLTVPARSIVFAGVKIPASSSQPPPKRRFKWWWRCDSGDIEFGVRRAAPGTLEAKAGAEEDTDVVVWPKWRLLTEHVPECRTITVTEPGLYKLVFDNSHGKIWSKHIKFYAQIIDE